MDRTTPMAALSLVVLAVTQLAGQSVPAACREPVEAERKGFKTPHHAYATEQAAQPGQAVVHETIMSGGVSYILYKGKWRRSPLTPAEMLSQLDENLASAKVLNCELTGTELVHGSPATVYLIHQTQPDFTTVIRLWVARSSGLVLRTEEDMDTGDPAGKKHISIRYDYDNVQAPAGAEGP